LCGILAVIKWGIELLLSFNIPLYPQVERIRNV
jgi:hypothetical protein